MFTRRLWGVDSSMFESNRGSQEVSIAGQSTHMIWERDGGKLTVELKKSIFSVIVELENGHGVIHNVFNGNEVFNAKNIGEPLKFVLAQESNREDELPALSPRVSWNTFVAQGNAMQFGPVVKWYGSAAQFVIEQSHKLGVGV